MRDVETLHLKVAYGQACDSRVLQTDQATSRTLVASLGGILKAGLINFATFDALGIFHVLGVPFAASKGRLSL